MIAYDSSRTALYKPEQADTVFVSGAAYTPLQLAVEAARLAYIRTEEFVDQLARLNDAMSRPGFSAVELFNDVDTGTQGFACFRASDGEAIVALRGTQPDKLSDLAVDITVSMTPWYEAGGNVHAGFAAAARAISPAIKIWIAGLPGQPTSLTITGHSLGAALATLIASELKPRRLVTIGSPRVGDSNFIASLAGVSEITRIVDCCDIVTELPPPIGGYTHTADPLYITSDGMLVPNAKSEYVAADRAKARAAYVLGEAWRIGSAPVRDLADHAPMNYVRAFFP